MRRIAVIGLVVGAGVASAQPGTGLDREQIVAELGIGPRLGPMNRCADATGQFGARVKIVVRPDGRVDEVVVASTDKLLRDCMASRIRGTRFPTTQLGATFGYEYRFRGVYPNVVARPIAAADVGPDPCEPVGALVAQASAETGPASLAMFDDTLALHAKVPACRGDRDRVVQRAIARACQLGDAAKAVAYARQTHHVWLDGMYACKDAKIRLPSKPRSGSLHVAHGRGHAWLEVAIDGENLGSPPINADVSPGRHKVEIWDSRTNTTHEASVIVPANSHVHLDERGQRLRVRSR